MSAASDKMIEMISSTSAHLVDRSEDAIFELVWVIKRSILSFPVHITKRKVQSVIDSAVLHWTTWLMVFPRNAGFGRCYLVSTRHEILSNIDRNLTGTRLRLRKNRNKINPARVRIPFQLYCCRLSLKQQKVLLSQSDAPTFNLTKASCWRFTKRTIAQARIHTGFHPFTEIGRIFHNKYIFSNKNAFQVEIWKMLDSPCLTSTTIWELILVK